MYQLKNKKKDYKFIKNKKIKDIHFNNGFLLNSHSKKFIIDGVEITNILIYDKYLVNPIVSKIVFKKFNKIINKVMNLLVDDDADGDEVFNLCLDEIEKFRQEIKNKYRVFLEQKELNFMAKRLKTLQKQVKLELIQEYNLVNSNNLGGKSR